MNLEKSSRALFLSIFIIVALAESVNATQDIKKWLRPENIPAPIDNKITPARVELGKFLYFDPSLSRDGTISCASCHNPLIGWSDNQPKAIGIEDREGPRNSPTVLNTAYQIRQFWDGRAKTLEEQALGPIQADVEMDMNLDILLSKLNKNIGYVALFEKAYPSEGITDTTLAKAIATFERTIVSTEAPFDKFIKGDKEVISKSAQDGFKVFTGKAHCADCHDGFNFSDGSFHNIALGGTDEGRYKIRKRAAWFHAFKTPTLRDIAKSAPYFHDGSVKTLKEATTICATGGRYPNGKNVSTFIKDRDLSEIEIDNIVEFMKTLSGKILSILVPTKFPQ